MAQKKQKVAAAAALVIACISGAPAASIHDHIFSSTLSAAGILLFAFFQVFLIAAITVLLRRQRRFRSTVRESESMFTAFLDIAQFPCFLHDLDGRYILANRAFYESNGLTPEQVIGRTSEEIGRGQTSEDEQLIRQRLLAGEKIISRKTSRRTAQGEEYFLYSANISDFQGRKAVFISSINITDQKKMEDELRQSEERFRRIFDLSPVPMVLLDGSGRLLEINRQFVRTLGYTADDMTTLDEWWLRAYPDPDVRGEVKKKWFDSIEKAIRSDGTVGPVEACIKVKDGSEHIMMVSAAMIGQTMLASFSDITDIRRSQEALRTSERRYAEALAATSDAIWEWDPITNRMYFSPRWYEMLGFAGGGNAMSFEEWRSLIHPDDVRSTIDLIQGSLLAIGGSGYSVDYRIRHRDGSWRWIRARGNVVTRSGIGTPTLFSGTNTDITAQKFAEDENRRLQAQMQQNQKIESVGRLAGGVAHDFNNMLGVILGYTELALRQVPENEKLHAQLTQIRKAAERSAELTRQLLAFARQQTAEPKVLDLNATVTGMLKLLQRLIGEDIDLAWKPCGGKLTLRIDPSQVDQILANLCVNARDAIKDTGAIVIRTSTVHLDEDEASSIPEAAPGNYVVLTVEDTGCGMDRETQSKIFEPFFTTKKVGEGTGLGLATIYGIVVQNRGFIRVDSEIGKGSSFMIYLPRFDGEESRASEQKTDPVLEGKGETILIVEDDPRMLDATCALLEQLGYPFLAAASPAEAMKLAEENAGRISLLMTDVIMPGTNGRELSRKARELIPSLKCLFMSGYTANIISTHGVLDEGVAFIQKPFTLAELGRKIRQTLDA